MLRIALIAILIIASGKLPAQVAFQKAFWEDGSSGIVRDVIPLTSGGYLLTGQYEGSIGLFKLNGSGDTLVARNYYTTFSSFGYRVLELTDGRVAVGASVGVVGGGPGIMMLDSNLNINWTSVIDGWTPNTIEGVVETYDGGAIILSSASGLGSGGGSCGGAYCHDLVIVRYSAQGDTLWSTMLGRAGINDYAAGIVQLPDSGFLIAGRGTGGVGDAILAKLNASGDTVFVRRYGASADIQGINFSALIECPDGGYLAAGQASQFFPGSIDFALVKLDSMLNMSWHQTYDFGGHEYINDITYTQSGDLVIVGRNSLDDSGIMARIDSQGEMEWAYRLNYQNLNLLTVAPTSDDGAMIGGSIAFTADSSGWYLARIDSLGHIGCLDGRDSLSWTTQTGVIGLEHGLEVNRGLDVQAFLATDFHVDINVIAFCDTCFSPPIANINHTTFLLDATFMDASEGSTNRTWYFPGGDTSNAVVAHYSFPAAGTYEVCLIARNDCGADTICDSVPVVCSQPVAGFDWETDTMTVAFLDQSQNATDWSWDFGDTNSDTGPFPVHTYTEKGDYWVCLDASNYCGNSQHCDSVAVNPVGVQKLQLSRDLQVFPNPTKGELTVRVNGVYQQQIRFTISDMTGRTRLDVQLPSPTEIIGLDLEPGVYVYRAEADGSVIGTARMVVIH